MNRWAAFGCLAVGVASLIAGAVSLGLAFQNGNQFKIETKIEKLRCELLNK